MKLSEEFKEKVRNSKIKAELSIAMDIPFSTLARWIKTNNDNLTKMGYQDSLTSITGLSVEEIFITETVNS